MLILGLLGMYFDASLVFVTSQTLSFRLALAILCPVRNGSQSPDQWDPTSFRAQISMESRFTLMGISWDININRVIAKSCGTLYNLQLLFFFYSFKNNS